MALRLELLNKNPTDFTPFGTKPAGIIMKDNTVQSYSVGLVDTIAYLCQNIRERYSLSYAIS